MTKTIKRIAITGGSGQIAYSLLFRVANGEIFGKDQPIALHILEVPEAVGTLKGVVMELEDCGFPNLKEIKMGSDPYEMFENVAIAILIGAKPRGPGMERKDLLGDNGKIFVEQGKALNQAAASVEAVFVVGNPCNTNCLIAMHHAPNIPKNRFHAMTRLDQNRAQFELSRKAGVAIERVEDVIIWGNHSATQVPDFLNAKIGGKEVIEVIKDRHYLEEEFFSVVQKRGGAVIQARGKSSAASAAHAIIGGIRSLLYKEGASHFFSSCILSDGNPYGIKEGLVFSFPCHLIKEGKVEIVKGLKWDDFFRKKIALTEKELLEERDLVSNLLS